jgi:hypothetical protein
VSKIAFLAATFVLFGVFVFYDYAFSMCATNEDWLHVPCFYILPVNGEEYRQAWVSSEYCDIDENIANSETLLRNDPVVKEFLKRFPSAEFQPPQVIDQSDPEQTYASYRFGTLTLELHILGYDMEDKTKCFVPTGYRLNAHELPKRVGLDYEKDNQVIIDLLDHIEPKLAKGETVSSDDPDRIVYSRPYIQNVTEIEIRTNSVFINGTVFGLAPSYVYKPALVIMAFGAIAIPSFAIWRVWRKRK